MSAGSGSKRTEQPAGIKPLSLVTRAVTAAAYGAVVLGVLWWGPLPTGVAFGVMAAFAAAEFYAMQRREARLPNEVFGVVAAGVMPVAAALWGLNGLLAVVTALLTLALLWHTVFQRVRTADTAETVFGALYTGFLLAYIVLLRSYDSGLVLALAVVLSVWLNDVGAYLVGSTLGRHKMAPGVSPKKSWEGLAAGTLACVGLWALVPLVPQAGIELPLALACGIAVATASVVGDLAESRMKREAGVKDSGTLLPGHGGFLDRLDSLILVCVVAYWVLWWGGVR
jgi:phosphatidate cytidylyltransferase